MTAAPSQTPEAAGLEVVRWIVEARYHCPPGYKSGGGVSGIRDSRTGAETWADYLRTYEGTESVTITPLVTAASAQAAIDAEKARADRLAKALEPFAVPHECDGHATVEDFNMEVQVFVRWSVIKAARAALQQETQP